ncbi:MAG: UbiX family flavin prenyltransferase [Candidatus Micrarchaeota archaeon]|nr:UbiX family flavin prenyltransferase [Candidatus Micrarchaeota archaeon]
MKIVLGVTGASGIQYAVRLAQALKKSGAELSIAVTDSAKKVAEYELPSAPAEFKKLAPVFSEHDIDAPFASGSAGFDAVVVCPASMKTVAAIACGFSYNAITRAADVAIKERKKLVLVPREMPMSEIHLENLLKLARLGAIIIPACPGFYHHPKKVGDLVNHVAGKVLDSLGVKHELFKRWGK